MTTRTATIRKELRFQYSQLAANEALVARLRFEMGTLDHKHSWIDSLGTNGSRECKYCWAGTDFHFMPLSDILAAINW